MGRIRTQMEFVGVDKTKRAFQTLNNNFNGATQGISKITSGLANIQGLIIGAFGGVAIAKIIDAGDEISKLNTRLGASTEALSQYQHVADLTGVTFQTLTLGLQRMTRRISEAAQGTGEAKNALKELGIDALAINRLRPEQQFEVIAEAMQSVDTQADKVRLAMKLFDTEGVSLLQTMEGGAATIRALREEADKLGHTLTAIEAQQFADVKDSLERLSTTVKGTSKDLVLQFAPAIIAVSNLLSEAIPTATDIANKAVTGLAFAVLKTFQFLVESAASFLDQLSAIPGALSDILQIADDLPLIGDAYGAISKSTSSSEKALKGYADSLRDSVSVLDFLAIEAESFEKAQKGVNEETKDFEQILKEVLKDKAELLAADENAKEAEKALNKLRSEAKSIFQQTRTPLEKYNMEITKLNELLDQGFLSHDTYNRALIQAQDALEKASEGTESLKKQIEDAAKTLSDDFADAIINTENGFDGLLSSFLYFTREIASANISNAFKEAFTAVSGNSSGASGDGGFLNNILGGFFGGFRASGGDVQRGKAYVVGEHEPEFFIPHTSGTIVPQSGMGAGARPINITFNISTPDANSFRLSKGQIAVQMQQALAMAQRNM